MIVLKIWQCINKYLINNKKNKRRFFVLLWRMRCDLNAKQVYICFSKESLEQYDCKFGSFNFVLIDIEQIAE